MSFIEDKAMLEDFHLHCRGKGLSS